jgi:hypothetical protein
VGTYYLHTLTSTAARYLCLMPPALGYQPRTQTARLLLIRLVVDRAIPCVTALTGPQRCPGPFTTTRLHTTPYRIDGSLPCLDYPYGRRLSSHLSLSCPSIYPQAGIRMRGFEPPTSSFRTKRANQTALHPVVAGPRAPQHGSLHRLTSYSGRRRFHSRASQAPSSTP